MSAVSCFNPRPREGATHRIGRSITRLGVSIHAPVRGRPDHCREVMLVKMFQSTPP
ncbi:conserved hypothetical protein [Magnetospirillum sp. UT-4]|nr:conserved hypothetical protein [Magnetospirillum sp. UT-4]